MPTAVQGTIRVTTAGGYSQIAVPAPASPPFVEFDALNATATTGTPASSSVASAVVGQTITLVGRGFNNSTVVQFPAEDQAGVAGVLGRTGSASADGTTLTITVPAQAVTGMLHVVGAGGSFELQVVPTLRSVGGTIAPGGSILIEGTGLAAGQVTMTVGGKAATPAAGAVHDTFADGLSQQAIGLIVPAGAAGAVIVVTTPGGSFTWRAAAPASLPALTPAADPGDTLTTATALGLAEGSSLVVHQQIGDGADGANDVNLYSFTGAAGDLITVNMGPTYTAPYTYTRLFNAAGVQLAIGNYGSEPELNMFVLPASGTYYIGVSSASNTGYNPAFAHSGSNGDYTGTYTMTATLVSGGGTSLAGTTAPAATSTQPALTPASDPGDTLTTATALGLAEDSKLAVNQKIGDGAGGANDVNLYSFAGTAGDLVTVNLGPANTNPYPVARLFDASGNQLAVGTYSQEPELNMFVLPASGTYYIGVSSWSDTSYNPTKSGSGSGGGYTGTYTMTVTRQALTGATATAGVGTPARSALASANPGQVITLTGSGLRANDQVVFETVDYNSSAVGWTAVNPISVSSDGTSLQVVVPDSAVSGAVRLARESVGLFLQVVPTVSNVDESSSAYHADGLTVEGSGLIEAGTTINFGGQSLADDGPSSGPDVVYDYANGSDRADGLVNLTVPNGVPYGPITVTTFGGTSNPFVADLHWDQGTATSGTPASSTRLRRIPTRRSRSPGPDSPRPRRSSSRRSTTTATGTSISSSRLPCRPTGRN